MKILFDVMVTTDSNISYQQNLPGYQIALIVLRAFRTSEELLTPLMPKVLSTIETIKPGQCEYVYADEALERKDQRKGPQKD